MAIIFHQKGKNQNKQCQMFQQWWNLKFYQQEGQDYAEESNNRGKKKINENDDTLQLEIEKSFPKDNVKINDEPNSESNVLNWWKDNAYKFPFLSKTGHFSVFCILRKVFSEAGNVFEERKDRLLPTKGKQLLF